MTAQGTGVLDGRVGDWLVVPGPLSQHEWRWGRIRAVIRDHGQVYYRVRWIGDVNDSVVLPPADALIESGARWPRPGGDAIGIRPGRAAGPVRTARPVRALSLCSDDPDRGTVEASSGSTKTSIRGGP
ncbi:DUF1918 domain-containing protein [Actinomycetes bacterium KLBMP 9759]